MRQCHAHTYTRAKKATSCTHNEFCGNCISRHFVPYTPAIGSPEDLHIHTNMIRIVGRNMRPTKWIRSKSAENNFCWSFVRWIGLILARCVYWEYVAIACATFMIMCTQIKIVCTKYCLLIKTVFLTKSTLKSSQMYCSVRRLLSHLSSQQGNAIQEVWFRAAFRSSPLESVLIRNYFGCFSINACAVPFRCTTCASVIGRLFG